MTYPSTPVFKEFKDKILTKNYENFTQYHLVYKHDNLDKFIVKSFLEECYQKYYFRFNWFIDYLSGYIKIFQFKN